MYGRGIVNMNMIIANVKIILWLKNKVSSSKSETAVLHVD